MADGLLDTLEPPIARSATRAKLPGLSFVFPMFNEAGNIRRCVAEARLAARELAYEYEIIIVDDASTDESGQIADRLALEHPEVRVIHHRVNQRFGGALRTGFAAATKEWVLYTDSDLPIRILDATAALPIVSSAEIVIGFRVGRCDGVWRRLMSLVYNRLIRLVFGLRVRDVNFAFKLFRRSVLSRVALSAEGGFIDAEFLLEARKGGARIVELGLTYQPRLAGKSTLASTTAVLNVLKDMWSYYCANRERPFSHAALAADAHLPAENHC